MQFAVLDFIAISSSKRIQVSLLLLHSARGLGTVPLCVGNFRDREFILVDRIGAKIKYGEPLCPTTI